MRTRTPPPGLLGAARARAAAWKVFTDPRVVFRVIRGYQYFGSYSVPNVAGGTEGRSCVQQHLVRGPEGRGGLLLRRRDRAADVRPGPEGCPAKAFDTLDQAVKYVNEGSEFANVQRMLMSLEIKN